MLKNRLFSAAIMILVIIYATSLAPRNFFLPIAIFITLLICYLAGVEYIGLRWNANGLIHRQTTAQKRELQQAQAPQLRKKHWLLGLAYVLPLLTLMVSELLHSSHAMIFALATIFFSVLAATFAIYLTNRDLSIAADRIISFIAGFIYITFACICFLKVVTMPFPNALSNSPTAYLLCSVVAMGDSAAYFIGVRLGKRKLAPHISPKKSLEGSVGGLVFSVLGAIIVNAWLNMELSLLFTISFGLVVGLAGQAGDLLESALKRASGFKDSGCLLPGHGGMLDRFDSFLLGAPVAFVMLKIYFLGS